MFSAARARGADEAGGGDAAAPAAAAPSGRPVPPPPKAYAARVEQAFPATAAGAGAAGGAASPRFKWKDYAPAAFATLRAAWGVDVSSYLVSLTGDRALRELRSPGKSGSVFFLSDDDRYLVKTVSREEMRSLLALVPAYTRHVLASVPEGGGPPTTLLTRFFGVHRVAPLAGGGSKVRFVVMGNVFPSDVALHRKFDIKGSTHGRTAGPAAASTPGAVLKDLDVDVALRLPRGDRAALLAALAADAALLEKLGVIDYSLLLGVHYSGWPPGAWRPPGAPPGSEAVAAPPPGDGDARPPPRGRAPAVRRCGR